MGGLQFRASSAGAGSSNVPSVNLKSSVSRNASGSSGGGDPGAEWGRELCAALLEENSTAKGGGVDGDDALWLGELERVTCPRISGSLSLAKAAV